MKKNTKTIRLAFEHVTASLKIQQLREIGNE